MLNTNCGSFPKRGEIWIVNFDPTVGTEIRKTRPAVVVSSDAIGILPIKLIAPITEWKEYYSYNIWHVRIEPDSSNGLVKPSAIDALQLRGSGYTAIRSQTWACFFNRDGGNNGCHRRCC